ncbi:MAG: DUF4173 domain-containing protein [Flavobacteriales bacterium]|jgi:hypothetical protein|nr:DUF4173 domain-containing protein [Flavobacteriales bacterium]MBK6548953.1 DUF4173 domain-containing protein [Flavobacteriales bacterium]MBK6884455.1 DUF4173 domain-containing protein [Flavobacteriales bacterium]MBK7111537.1 DUF4173 domain-containing protein [Flavobacteriales bacterium]MBK7484104.1 DUF4173 domain-containing protein [Flavobacteriales bacterium]
MDTTTIPASSLRSWRDPITLLFLVMAFDILFWERALGLDLLVFIALVLVVLVAKTGWNGLSRTARMTMGGALLAGIMVVVHHSSLAMAVAILALVVSSAAAQEARLRSLFYSLLHASTNILMTPFVALGRLDRLPNVNGVPRTGWRWVKLVALPLLLLLLFTQLYRAGNPKFDHLTAGFMDGLWEFLSDALSNIFTAHTFFLLFGLLACAGSIFRFAPRMVIEMEDQWQDVLVRTRRRLPQWASPRSMDGLERERRMGVILLVLVNLLLVVVNAIDVQWLWFGFEVPVDFSLKQFVHEGTWMLIISILLSMVILMYFFRNNMNFYARSRSLRTLALLWVGQNLVLGISVFLRNYQYIAFHGLAYKRIGVIVFLGLVLVGLVTLYFKVRDKKSLFYLARVNGWAMFTVLIALTTVDWDSAIVRFNLGHWNRGEIDVDNYLAMSDKVLPLLYADLDKVEGQMARHRSNTVRWVEHLDPQTFRMELDVKRDLFEQRVAQQHWQEWNLADQRTANALHPMSDPK